MFPFWFPFSLPPYTYPNTYSSLHLSPIPITFSTPSPTQFPPTIHLQCQFYIPFWVRFKDLPLGPPLGPPCYLASMDYNMLILYLTGPSKARLTTKKNLIFYSWEFHTMKYDIHLLSFPFNSLHILFPFLHPYSPLRTVTTVKMPKGWSHPLEHGNPVTGYILQMREWFSLPRNYQLPTDSQYALSTCCLCLPTITPW